MSGRPAVFFDRDGIVNVRPVRTRYVETTADFHLIPAFFDALRLVRNRGYAAFIVTNQRGVGLGIMTPETLNAIHNELIRHLRDQNLALDGIRVCTADDNSHPDRKPNPGLLLGAASEHRLDLAKSWMIGDRESDVLAGLRAGCRTILVSDDTDSPSQAKFRIPDMHHLIPLLDRVLAT